MPKSSSTPTLTEFAATFLEDMQGNRAEGTIRNYRQYLDNHLLPTFGHLHLSGITKGPVQSEFYRAHFYICAGAALRIGEVAGLNMGDWDPETGLLRVERQFNLGSLSQIKNGETGDVAPLDFALLYLNALVVDPPKWRQPGDAMLRGLEGKRIQTQQLRDAWIEGRRNAKLNDFHVHDLRHLSISAMARASKDLKETQQFARHRDPASTLRYMHALTDVEAKKANSAKASAEFGIGA